VFAKSHDQDRNCTDIMKKENTQKSQPQAQPQAQKKISLKDLKANKEVKGGIRQI